MTKIDIAKIGLLITIGALLIRVAYNSAEAEGVSKNAYNIASRNTADISDLKCSTVALLETVKHQAMAAKQHYDYTVTSIAAKMKMMKCIERLVVLMETHEKRLTLLERRKE